MLTKDAPLGDLAYGIDNSFASRAIDEGVVQPYVSTAPAATDAAQYAVDGSDALTAIDKGDVCINVDHAWFTAHEPGRAGHARGPHQARVQGPDAWCPTR